jgi:enoyl-CoA hydratase/3-hydroxyacyl-CoA dehydrogenase
VFEDLTVKTDLFKQLSTILDPQAILATNTSSFSVDELSQHVTPADRFLGLHFFYHAAKNRLVEIIRGNETSEEVFETIFWFMQRCGKDPILCQDAHGFVVNRFFVPWLNEAVRLLEEEVATPGIIDTVACKTFGCGMGPFALMNATGVPIAYHAARTLGEAYGAFYKPAKLLKTQMEKNQQWEISSEEEPATEKEEIIRDRLLAAVVLVCGQLLDEGVCSVGDIHRGAAIGLRWRKTPVLLTQKLGKEKVTKLIQEITSRWQITTPNSFKQLPWKVEFVQVERRGSTGIIVLNRPEGLNALNVELMEQLAAAAESLDGDATIETIVLLGRGKAFMAGADIRFFLQHMNEDTLEEIEAFTHRGQELFQRLDNSSKTVVAILNGLALGGGLELALTADILYAIQGARLAFPETGLGIYPALGGTQRPQARIGAGLTKYLIFTGQQLSAVEARNMGLVDQVITWEMVPDILQRSQHSLPPRQPLADQWRATTKFFESHTLHQILSDSFPEPWRRLVKIIRRKAPRALAIAETLINAHEGPASELKYLREIFSTKDALIGLQSIGQTPPKFTGE